MKASLFTAALVAAAAQPLCKARPTTTITVSESGQQCDRAARRLCQLPDGTISSVEGYLSYDRQQETYAYQER